MTIAYRYYKELVPEEIGTKEDRFQCAILMAKERQRTYHVPAVWTLVKIVGDWVHIKYSFRKKEGVA